MTMLNVAIAEDNPKTMEVLNEMLEKESGVQIVGRAQTGEDALEMIKTTKPDVVLMDDDPLKISKAIRIARKCMRIVYENIYFAIGIKVLCLILGALGIANMWLAIFADVGVMVLAVLNAIRVLFVKKL